MVQFDLHLLCLNIALLTTKGSSIVAKSLQVLECSHLSKQGMIMKSHWLVSEIDLWSNVPINWKLRSCSTFLFHCRQLRMILSQRRWKCFNYQAYVFVLVHSVNVASHFVFTLTQIYKLTVLSVFRVRGQITDYSLL